MRLAYSRGTLFTFELRVSEVESGLRQDGDVGLDDAPTFGEADPDLGLAAADEAVGGVAFELQGDAAVVGAEGDDLHADLSAGEADRGAGLAEGFYLFGAVEVFAGAEADGVR